MKRSRRTLAALALVGVFGVPAAANQAGEPSGIRIDVSKLGPQVGERAPDFNLKDQNGNTLTLRSIMGPRGAVLVFIRSADW